MSVDTLSLSWSAGNGLECAVHRADKLILLPMHGPPQVLILQLSGHQTWMDVQINLLQLHACAAASGVRAAGYLEPAMKAVRNGCALLHMACNVVQVAVWFGYTLDKSFGSCRCVQRCQECR